MQTIGEFKKAKSLYVKILKLNKLDVRSYYGLFNLNPKNLTDNMFANLSKIEDLKKTNLYESAVVNFLLSKEKKKKKY